MTSSDRADWLIPAGLVTLSAIPTVAGISRVVQLAIGAQITPDNARFLMAPLPVVLHILSSVIFCVLGAFQFSPGLRRRYPDWHRGAGRTLIPCGLVAALAGVWMAHFYPTGINPPASFDGPFVYAIRLVAGTAMALSLCFGFAALRRRDIPRHRAWMLRGYALGLGAGTQVVTHLPWYLLPDIQGEVARTLFMAAGWGVNLAVAEWSISCSSGMAAPSSSGQTTSAGMRSWFSNRARQRSWHLRPMPDTSQEWVTARPHWQTHACSRFGKVAGEAPTMTLDDAAQIEPAHQTP